MTDGRGRRPKLIIFLCAALAGAGLLVARGAEGQPGPARPAAAAPRASGSLTAFRSEAELRRFLRRVREERPPPPPMPAPAPMESAAPAAGDALNDLPSVRSTFSQGTQGITNNQEVNVDEGGIVKVRGNILVILRRGRLFTVSLAGGGMRAIDAVNAFPPGVSGQGDWYDEMLLSGDRVIVVGYSYARGGTEINRFRLDAAGRLRFEDAYHLKSNDYYSSRNYASRLIGNRLVFYTPLDLDWDQDPLQALPGVRKWRPGLDEDSPFRRIAGPRQIFVAPSLREAGAEQIDTLHSVTSCDLTTAELDCSATAVFGPSSRTFYVSGNAVYLWVANWRDSRRAFIYRLPFGREAPSAIGARGAPVDQFSFREDARDGVLNVLVRGESGGDAMGGPEVSGGGVALLRVPIASFGDGSRPVPPSRYRRLPSPGGEEWSFRNRFVGDHVLYGAGAFGEGERRAQVIVAPVRGGPVAELPLRHAVGRIEALGADAVVVGSDADQALGFTAIELGRQPRLGDLFLLPAASEGETRSHAFFFRPDTADGASGILGLPIAKPVDAAYRRFFGSAAAMLFLRRDARRFSPAGELDARVAGTADDGCQASCVDWYGNARPIFLGSRVFALLGYELVEGRLDRTRIREVRRLSFSPRARRSERD